jgi:hypothetical protein|tara:strand:+ start:731 stop:961 length:231 start_codon:yes stop_codon:yes gene_type:complete
MLERLRTAGTWIGELTEVSLGLLALAVVLQVLFGATVPFFPIDVIGSVVDVTNQLGSEGLVGLVAVWVLMALLNRN